jgi:hypothetical protein
VSADDRRVLWVWILGGLLIWLVVALVVALVVGRGIRLADQSAASSFPTGVLTADLAGAAATRPLAARTRRRAVPLPPVGVVLVVVALALESTGYLIRLTGGTGQYASVLSMDAPWSLPRMFVAAVFAAAALAAVAGAGSIPGRRTWWMAVGLVAGGIAAVKAGSTIHSDALRLLTEVAGQTGALLVSIGAAALVLGVLGFLSRAEPRDRRRVLGLLGLYAAASVGLSAVSAATAGSFGYASSWAAATTFIEESGEALAGVSFLVAVLIGVAPNVVLPASWALRRSADAHTLELPEGVPGGSIAEGPARS